MKLTSLFASLALASLASAQTIQINEIYASHAGTDTDEFIELKGTPNMKLDGYMVLVVEGEGTGAGTLDRAWDLTGLTMPNDGYFVLGDDTVTNVDFKLGASNAIENGTETFYLVKTTNQTAIIGAVNSNLDPDGDLKTTIPTLATIVDIVAMVGGGATDKVYDGATKVGPDGTFFPAGIYRAADATWCGGFLDFDNTANTNAPRTPGAINTLVCAPSTASVVGMSCLTGAGSIGGPDLAATNPQIGKAFTTTVSNAGTGAVGFLYLGLVAATPSPFLNCNIYITTAPLLNVGAFAFSGTTGTLALPIPYSVSLLNTQFGVQGAVGTTSTLHLTNGLSCNAGY
ncbi:MAG: hypothetical protein KDC87_07560 [Planctomycetes bacterium]|nr:hypothetical protein [Planctomycetota bacterium]MCB9871377.1 hypothetical protein [Planctomycetota bacterium]